MAVDLHPCDHTNEEEYIDMEVSSNSNFFCHSMNSPPHRREFEFQMFSSSSERETTTSPADELFYKGKLLPLHLPPRLQMVEKLFQNSNPYHTESFREDYFSTPLATTTYTTPTTNTPFESCNISPSESCQVSRELNPNDYFFEYSADISSFVTENPKKSWARKLKLIKQYTLGSKLKASRAYLKSLFRKSGCSDEPSMATPRNINEGPVSKTMEFPNKYAKVKKKAPFGQIQSFNKEKMAAEGGARHRRSFSGAIKRLSTIEASSSSSSGNSNGSHESHLLKRSGSVSSDVENSIQSAIAHCKRSQQEFQSRKIVSEVGFYSLAEDQKRPGICRG
ncbi:Membrane-associated kinase regulator 4 [Actinidia chinensis var. chinensis]|uniref:Membrane-associated kinase regulator 4 n=1 Tax=Actinidia chinensis var. chinensis TaxID=1590841 RepID=A0A2R6RTY2_ACTCC|nr:Membrane-associated kinase regulator 4 [Actinidia chinensis var. chinensis]